MRFAARAVLTPPATQANTPLQHYAERCVSVNNRKARNPRRIA